MSLCVSECLVSHCSAMSDYPILIAKYCLAAVVLPLAFIYDGTYFVLNAFRVPERWCERGSRAIVLLSLLLFFRGWITHQFMSYISSSNTIPNPAHALELSPSKVLQSAWTVVQDVFTLIFHVFELIIAILQTIVWYRRSVLAFAGFLAFVAFCEALG